MAINFIKAAATAKRLIEANGRPITLLQSSATPLDGAKPWRGSSAPHTEATPGAEVAAIGVFVNQSNESDFGLMETNVKGELLKRGVQHCLVAATGLTPDLDVSKFDAIKDGTDIWSITDANVLQPGSVRVLYDFEVSQ